MQRDCESKGVCYVAHTATSWRQRHAGQVDNALGEKGIPRAKSGINKISSEILRTSLNYQLILLVGELVRPTAAELSGGAAAPIPPIAEP